MAKSRRRGGCGWGGRKRTRGGALQPSFAGTIGTAGADWGTANIAQGVNRASAGDVQPNSTGNYAPVGGRRRSHKVTAKAIKRVLKKAGLKTSGSKRTLTKRARKARLMGGGPVVGTATGSYAGTGSAGMADQVTGVHPGGADVKSV